MLCNAPHMQRSQHQQHLIILRAIERRDEVLIPIARYPPLTFHITLGSPDDPSAAAINKYLKRRRGLKRVPRGAERVPRVFPQYCGPTCRVCGTALVSACCPQCDGPIHPCKSCGVNYAKASSTICIVCRCDALTAPTATCFTCDIHLQSGACPKCEGPLHPCSSCHVGFAKGNQMLCLRCFTTARIAAQPIAFATPAPVPCENCATPLVSGWCPATTCDGPLKRCEVCPRLARRDHVLCIKCHRSGLYCVKCGKALCLPANKRPRRKQMCAECC